MVLLLFKHNRKGEYVRTHQDVNITYREYIVDIHSCIPIFFLYCIITKILMSLFSSAMSVFTGGQKEHLF